MTKLVENILGILMYVFLLALGIGVSIGFYYLIFVVAKKVFFG